MEGWFLIGFFVFAAFCFGLFVFLALNGGVNTRNGFVGIEKTPEQMDAMITKVKARQARYDTWREGLNRRKKS